MTFEPIIAHKELRIAGAAANAWASGFEYSLWQFEGNPSDGDVPPTSWTNPTNATIGALMQNDPAGGLQKWLASMVAIAATGGRLVLYDRLAHVSGLSGTVTTAQNVNVASVGPVTRHYVDPTGLGNADDGNEIFLEIYSTIGATSTTVTAAYTDSAGASKTTAAVAIGNTNFREAARMIRLPIDNTGAPGVQSVTSVTLAGTTGTAGNFGLVIAHRLLEIEIGSPGMPELWSGVDGSFIEILAGACLAFSHETASSFTATSSALDAFLNCVDK